jgi:hypothetical protein
MLVMTVPPGPHTQTDTHPLPGTYIYTVTATSANGCTYTATETVIVNPSPAPIVGDDDICKYDTKLYTCSTPGGTWSVAGVNVSLSPVSFVTGVTVGPDEVRYTLPNGCKAVKPIMVKHPAPPITGPSSICVLDVATYGAGTPMVGTWDDGGSSVANIDMYTGVLTAISAGTVIITFTNPSLCSSTLLVSVGTAPPIVGVTTLCGIGAMSTLSFSEPGGSWTSSDPSIASVGSSTGLVTGVGIGTATITYHRVSGLCNPTVIVTVAAYLLCPLVWNPAGYFDIVGWMPGTTVSYETYNIFGLSGSVTGFTGSSITSVPTGTTQIVLTAITIGSCVQTGMDCTVTYPSPSPKPGRSADEQNAAWKELFILPNPNNGSFTLTGQLPCADACTVEIEVTDVLGKTIYSEKVNVDNGNLNTRIALGSEIANGVYLVRVKNNDISEVIRFTLNR